MIAWRAESPLGQWALRTFASLAVFIQGLLLAGYVLMPKETQGAPANGLLEWMEIMGAMLAMAIVPTFLLWLSLPGSRGAKIMGPVLIATWLGSPLITYLLLVLGGWIPW